MNKPHANVNIFFKIFYFPNTSKYNTPPLPNIKPHLKHPTPPHNIQNINKQTK